MHRYRILVVEDDHAIRNGLTDALTVSGYDVLPVKDGYDALNVIHAEDYDLALLDVVLPGASGFDLLRLIREDRATVPILMLTAKGAEADKVRGLKLGADDYVVKPFSPKELMMRVKVVIDRNGGRDSASTNGHEIFQAEGLVIDFTGRTVTVDGKRAELSPKEYDLLFYLVRNRNIALEREKLITEVWGYDYYGDDRTLDTHIKLLRSSLGDYRKFLVTLRGVGYRFEA